MLIYTHCWELMNSVGSHGSSSLPFVMKVMDSPSQLLDRRECSSFQAGKLVLLCWDAGPAFDPWGIATFSRVLAVMNLSLHLKTNLSRARA